MLTDYFLTKKGNKCVANGVNDKGEPIFITINQDLSDKQIKKALVDPTKCKTDLKGNVYVGFENEGGQIDLGNLIRTSKAHALKIKFEYVDLNAEEEEEEEDK